MDGQIKVLPCEECSWRNFCLNAFVLQFVCVQLVHEIERRRWIALVPLCVVVWFNLGLNPCSTEVQLHVTTQVQNQLFNLGSNNSASNKNWSLRHCLLFSAHGAGSGPETVCRRWAQSFLVLAQNSED